MFHGIRNYFSEPARAERKRKAERKMLLKELDGLAPLGSYADGRRGYIARRLATLDKVEAAAALEASGAPERRKKFRLVAPAPDYVIADEVIREAFNDDRWAVRP